MSGEWPLAPVEGGGGPASEDSGADGYSGVGDGGDGSAMAVPEVVPGSDRGRFGGARRWLDVALVVVILLGIGYRFAWVDWSEGTDLHPDEYGLTSTLTNLHVPHSLGDYFNTRLSPLSPYQKLDAQGRRIGDGPDNAMRWGQWPQIVIRVVAQAYTSADQAQYHEIRLVGRRLSALCDSVSVLFVVLIAAHLYGRRVGLLAGALSAHAVLQIQASHFMTVDNWAAMFTTAALYAAVRLSVPARMGAPQSRRMMVVWAAAFGVATGMALASRINLVPLVGMIAVAAAVAVRRGPRQGGFSWRLAVGCVALAGVATVATFRVTQPMSFRAPSGDTTVFTVALNPDWVAAMRSAQCESSGQCGAGPPGEQWTNRPIVVFPFTNMVLWGMGLPLGLAAWAGVMLGCWRIVRDRGDAWLGHVVLAVWTVGYFAFMATRWLKSVRYFLPIYPTLAIAAAWLLVVVWRWSRGAASDAPDARRWRVLRLGALVLPSLVLLGTLAWSWGYTAIYRRENTRLAASRWIFRNAPAALSLAMEDGSRRWLRPVLIPDGAVIKPGEPLRVEVPFSAPGKIVAVAAAHVLANSADATAQVEVRLQRIGAASGAPTSLTLRAAPGAKERARQEVMPAIAVAAGDRVELIVSVPPGHGAVTLRGTTIACEHWDEWVPIRVDGLDASVYGGVSLDIRGPDDERKRRELLLVLGRTDFIVLPSQRALWSAARLPLKYPMLLAYYRALFDGSLGFDLVNGGPFQSLLTVGWLNISDAGAAVAVRPRFPALPVANTRALAAEEAFSVYDHAPVWVFRKRADFDPAPAQRLLSSFDLTQVVDQEPRAATRAPTLLMLPPDRLAEQRRGGTWRTMFDRTSLVNRSDLVAATAWYLFIALAGWAVWPLLFTAFRVLPDRGFPLARSVALLLVAWGSWFAASLRWLPFERGTLAIVLVAIVALSAAAGWRQRQALAHFLRARRTDLLVAEMVFALLFLAGIALRIANPDLWHPRFGGEKPMVMSYFNAVLRSTSFPPYDPWLAGGFLNYYYFGYVIAAVPTKLLGIEPAVAYNLLLPTFFALVGLGVYSVASNLVVRRWRRPVWPTMGGGEPGPRPPDWETSEVGADGGHVAADATASSVVMGAVAETGGGAGGVVPVDRDTGGEIYQEAADVIPTAVEQTGIPLGAVRRSRQAFPLHRVTGVVAVLLAVVVGNLGQVLVLGRWLQAASGHPASSLADVSPRWAVAGAWKLLARHGEAPGDPGVWYWDATRLANEYTHSSEISEFPFFTVLYADLHAHLLDLPLVLLAISVAVVAVRRAGRRRRPAELVGACLLGGIAIGAIRATSTWDFPTFLALASCAVVAAVLLGRRPTRRVVTRAVLEVGALAGVAWVAFLPFDYWFASPLVEVERFRGPFMAVQPYLLIFGVALAFVVTSLAVETRNWAGRTKARVLAPRWGLGAWIGAGLLAVVAACLSLAALGISISWIAVPIAAWAAALIPVAEERTTKLALFLVGTALALTLFCEVYAIGADRMNTVFKLYYQAWLLLAIAGGVAVAGVLADIRRWSAFSRRSWLVAAAALLAMGLVFPMTAAPAKGGDRFPVMHTGGWCATIPAIPLPPGFGAALPAPHGLDGTAFMAGAAVCDESVLQPLAWDRDAIFWLQDHVDGSPVIVEAQSFDLYRTSSRYAWFTGLPDVVGWDWHQRQQRGAALTEPITQRGREVSTFYATASVAEAKRFLARYDAGYVILGPMEQAYYRKTGGLAKFQEMEKGGILKVAYHNPGVTVYRVVRGASGLAH